MSSIAKKTLSLVIGLSALLVLVAFVYLSYESFSLRSQALSARAEISSAGNRESYLMSIRNVLKGTEGNVHAVEKRFIAEDEVPDFAGFLEGEIGRFGLQGDITSISLDPPGKGGGFRNLRVRLSVEGSWKDSVSFLSSLDTGERSARIEKVSFSKTESETWVLTADIIQYVR